MSRYQMRQDMFSIGDDWWLEDHDGNKAFRVGGKAMRFRDTFVLEDAAGNEVAKIQERTLHIRDTMAIELGGKNIATVHNTPDGLPRPPQGRPRGRRRDEDKGSLTDHEYEIKGEHGKIAEISKRWFRVRHTYGVDIADKQDDTLLLAITVAVEDMSKVVD